MKNITCPQKIHNKSWEASEMTNPEKRSYARHDCEASIMCAYFNTEEFFPAKMRNYGIGGLYFESDFAFRPGSCVYIRMTSYRYDNNDADIHEGFRTMSIGEIRWRMEIRNKENAYFGFGVKYYESGY